MTDLERHAEEVNKMGDKLMKRKQFGEAIAYYQDSLNLMLQAGNHRRADSFRQELEKAIASRAAELNKQGDGFYKQRMYKQAMDLYQAAYNMINGIGGKWLQKYGAEFSKELTQAKSKYATEVLQPQVRVLMSSGQWRDALNFYQQLMDFVPAHIDQKTHDQFKAGFYSVYEQWATMINREGDNLYATAQYGKAIDKYAQAVHLIIQTPNNAKIAQFKKELSKAFQNHAQDISNRGSDLVRKGRFQDASVLYEESIQIAKEGKLDKLVALFTKELENAYAKFAEQINARGNELYRQWKYSEAADIFHNSILIAKEAKNSKLVAEFTKQYNSAIEKWAINRRNEANLACNDMNWEKAITVFAEVEEIANKAADKKQAESFIGDLRRIYLNNLTVMKPRADYALSQGKLDDAYKLYDFCVRFATMAQNDRKMKEFREYRDKAMEKMG